MKTWKLVSGILSILFALFVFFQSSMVGLGNSLAENGEVSGTAGLFVGILLLTCGIVSIATRNAQGKGGDVAMIILMILAAITGFAGAGSYSDLYIWSSWCVLCMIFAFVSLGKHKKAAKAVTGPSDGQDQPGSGTDGTIRQ